MAGDRPWPQVPIGNKNHANAAVLIIGAGFSGICTAIDLIKRNDCRNFIIVEKSGGVGGTWHDNRYPGCCCDVWSALYSFSFAQNTDWTRLYPGQEEILRYLVDTAQKYNIYQHVRFNTTVEEATWDETAMKWRTKVTTAPGSKDAEFSPQYEITSDFLVSAVGQLNQPKWPDIAGLDSFGGKKIHSARWDWSYDLRGKRIAMIGNGCTAVQILPEIAEVAESVTVFQRTPNYVIPREDGPISTVERAIYKYMPPVLWRRRAAMMDFREAFYPAVTDKNSPAAKEIRRLCLEQIHAQLPQETWESLTPRYEPGAKRVIISDDFYPALNKPNVKLEMRPIHSITQHTVMLKDGDKLAHAQPKFDLLICATGFKTVDFLHPVNITGRKALSQSWKDGAQALYGITVEDMPNFAMLYGPNTNLGHNSIILMIEAQSRYINGLISPVLQARSRGTSLAITPKHDRMVEYNEQIQKELQASSFNDPNCTSWYRNEAGRITNNWSRTVVDYQKMVSTVDFDDFELDGEVSAVRMPQVKVGRVVEETQISNMALASLSLISAAAVAAGWIFRRSHFASSVA